MQANKKALEIQKKVCFAGGNVDSFLYMKKGVKGIVHIALYTDNNLMLGSPEEIDETVEQLKEMG